MTVATAVYVLPRRMAGWATEWSSVEPLWTTRTH